MENNAGMSELLEIIFCKKSTIHGKSVVHSSIRSNFLTEDFSKKLLDVLFFRKLVVFHRFQSSIDYASRHMSSHQEHLTYAMLACLSEDALNEDKFDRFISACALVIKWTEEILERTGVNFQVLNADIFMVFYLNVLKSSFRRHDFKRLVEFISDHKYLKWNRDHIILVDDPNTPVLNESDENVIKELESVRPFRDIPKEKKASHMILAQSYAQKVVLSTSVELPSLPSTNDLIARLVAFKKKQMAKTTDEKRKGEAALTNETLHRDSSTDFDAETDCIDEQQEAITRHENIIRAVIRHNHSKRLGHENSNNQIHEEAEGILSHLKKTMQSLIKNLNDCDKKCVL